jgi:succinate dehydrogenase / fumarate reductase, membrane anchor subunit
MSLRSPLGRVLGQGAAKEGVHHWWIQRLTSLALVPLSLWFVLSLALLPSLDHQSVVQWMRSGWTAPLLVLFVVVTARHSQLGVQVVVEDYVHHGSSRTVTLIVLGFIHVLLAAAGVYAVLQVVFGGTA